MAPTASPSAVPFSEADTVWNPALVLSIGTGVELLIPDFNAEPALLDEVFAAVPYCVDLIGGPYITTNPTVVDAFRPPHARRE